MFAPYPFFRVADGSIVAIKRTQSTISAHTFLTPYYVSRRVLGVKLVEQVVAGLSYTELPDCFQAISNDEAKQAEPMLYEYVQSKPGL